MDIDDGLFANYDAADARIRKMLAGGLGVLERVVSDVATSSGRHFDLEECVARSTYPAALPLLAKHVTADSLGLVESAALALARSGDGPMLELLCGVLRDRDEFHMKRACIARVMGGTTNADAQAALREAVDQEVSSVSDEEYPALLVEAVTALAKCGDQGRSPALLDIIRSGVTPAGSLAVQGLKVALPAGMLACIRDAAEDPHLEIQPAVEALCLLGTKASCELLIQMAESDDFDVAFNSLVSAGNIVGTPVMDLDELPDVQAAWLALRSDMRDDVCYRSGEPLDPRKLFDGLVNASTPGGRDRHASEMEIRSGLDVRGAILFGEEQRLAGSLDRLSMQPGATYRWGHRHPAPGTW